MYPGTKFNWIDLTTLGIQEPEAVDDSPLFLQAFACDKGPEDITVVKGEDFANLYGVQSFSKYGQAGIQAQNIINAGGRLMAKRVVAQDSLLAYTIFVAKVFEKEVEDPKTHQTSTKVGISWSKVPTDTDEPTEDTKFKTFDEVLEYAKTLEDESNGVYPVMVVADNGRGVSGKSVRIVPDYITSKSYGSLFYTIAVLEGTAIVEKQPMTLDTTVILDQIAYRLDNTTCVQIDGLTIESVYDHFVKKIKETYDGIYTDPKDQKDEKYFRSCDLINGYSYKGSQLDWAYVPDGSVTGEDASLNLAADTGIALQFGDNGAFDKTVDPDDPNAYLKPKDTQAYEDALCAFFEGTDIPDDATRWIYDLDEYKISAVVDANYPFPVKKAIADLANTREDFVYFRDYGLGLKTFAQIRAIHDGIDNQEDQKKTNERCILDPSSWFIMDYCTSYKMIDPVERKQIDVTMTYDLAGCLVSHIARNAVAPVAGFANGFILPSAIKGTISFVPQIQKVWDGQSVDEEGYKVFTDDNQKQAMDDLHVNYAIFQGDDCVVQGTYSAHKKETQLIYGNNILAIQEVMRAIRTACPRIRYSLSTGEDLENYRQDVENVLERFQNNFSILNFVYTSDPLMIKQKIFKASIEFAFLDWAQSEIFDIYAIDND